MIKKNFPQNRAAYEIMCKNMVDTDKTDKQQLEYGVCAMLTR